MYASNGSIDMTVIAGNLGKDPKFLPGDGNPVAFFSVAKDASYHDRGGNKVDKTVWLDCKAFGKNAEQARDYLTTGRKVGFIANHTTRVRQLIDPADNQTKNFTFIELEVREWTFLDKKPAEESGSGHQSQQGRPHQQNQQPQGGYQNQGQPSRPAQNQNQRPTAPPPQTGRPRF